MWPAGERAILLDQPLTPGPGLHPVVIHRDALGPLGAHPELGRSSDWLLRHSRTSRADHPLGFSLLLTCCLLSAAQRCPLHSDLGDHEGLCGCLLSEDPEGAGETGATIPAIFRALPVPGLCGA